MHTGTIVEKWSQVMKSMAAEKVVAIISMLFKLSTQDDGQLWLGYRRLLFMPQKMSLLLHLNLKISRQKEDNVKFPSSKMKKKWQKHSHEPWLRNLRNLSHTNRTNESSLHVMHSFQPMRGKPCTCIRKIKRSVA